MDRPRHLIVLAALLGACGDARPPTEVCNGVDDDGDGTIDEDALVLRFRDEDGDGHGAAGSATWGCDPGEGWVASAGDCDDRDPARHPDRGETCDGVDEDCDGVTDEHPTDGVTVYGDADGDGFGSPEDERSACAPGPGEAADGEDCDDGDAAVHPGAADVCHDGIEADCDASTCDVLAGRIRVADAGVLLASADPADNTGVSVASGGDVDGDGLPDLVLAANGRSPGGIWVVTAATPSGAPLPDTAWREGTEGEEVGFVAGIAELDGDPAAEVFVSASTGAGGSTSWATRPPPTTSPRRCSRPGRSTTPPSRRRPPPTISTATASPSS